MIIDKQLEKVMSAIAENGKEICENESLTIEQMLDIQDKQMRLSNLFNYLANIKQGFEEKAKQESKIVTLQ